MNWKTLIAILLLLPMCWWCGLPPLWSTVELAEHYAVFGEHCDDLCVHPSPLIDPPQASASLDIPSDESVHLEQLIALLPQPHTGRDRLPSLLYSTSRSLRAPPSLIFA
ncbi:MAG: hypothetical protein HOP22_03295 [Nitrospiraceae bacterium]|nr:hypothetical protein [Nitrospiraceae bacterium]